MNATLRKLVASVVLAFSDGTQAQTLVGTDFALNRNQEHNLSLHIDFSNNLHPRNRGLLCYYEAQGLLLQHALLQSLRIGEKDLVTALRRELNTEAPVQLVLALGEGRVFSYAAQPAISDRTVTLTIHEPEKAAGAI